MNQGRVVQGPRLTQIISAVRRGALKLRKQMPPTMAAADRQARIAATQSPLATLMSVP
ncbi:Uncharacterised protein [Bordetella pertussis]|nr:Uncharacterised protein [Bordetella pertussis]CFN56117.1 Uncharacterised protein [Bordetella pertussis]CFO10111.1 Uncharacterised protein [Bordetella pertussis]CFO33953.1 Uncharacterised protein [Bordetella pertussis]CFO43357.1 Uncharacterised protein [Bordetella pertussis]